MAKVELKQPIVEEISAGIKDAKSVVLVDYRGLTVEQDTRLRKELRENGVTYKVYKNTMMNFAFKGTDFEGLAPLLEGPSALAYSTEDATAPARIICGFAKKATAARTSSRSFLTCRSSLPYSSSGSAAADRPEAALLLRFFR